MNRFYRVAVAAFVTIVMSASSVFAADCTEHFTGGTRPHIGNAAMLARVHEFCFAGYGSLYSPVSRTPLYSASHLTKARVEAARSLPRVNSFHEETTLAPDERSWLSDYSRSGFDRGHVAPNGDMPDADAQEESFTLANMVPQVPENNRGIWAGIESAVRNLALRRGEVYVVTGPVFRGSTLRRTPSGRVLVPSDMFKAVYVPSTGESGVYISPNDTSGGWSPLSVKDFTAMTGIDPFPSVQTGKDRLMELPQPSVRR